MSRVLHVLWDYDSIPLSAIGVGPHDLFHRLQALDGGSWTTKRFYAFTAASLPLSAKDALFKCHCDIVTCSPKPNDAARRMILKLFEILPSLANTDGGIIIVCDLASPLNAAVQQTQRVVRTYVVSTEPRPALALYAHRHFLLRVLT